MGEEGRTVSPTAKHSGQKADCAAVLPGGGCSGRQWKAIDANGPFPPFDAFDRLSFSVFSCSYLLPD
jgi:hypothetical protein